MRKIFFLLLLCLPCHAAYYLAAGIIPSTCTSGLFVNGVTGNSLTCATPAGGGNVTGAPSSTTHHLAGFADASGTLLEDSGIAESAVATLTGTQTLTNKTLTSPTINAGSFGTSATFPYATTGTAGIFNGSGQFVSSVTTSTELTYIHGVQSSLTVENMDGEVSAPGNSTFYVRPRTYYPGTIISIYIFTTSGTDTVAININGTPVTGLGAISVSSTPQSVTATAANTFTSGQQITLVTSSDAAAVNLSWSILVSR